MRIERWWREHSAAVSRGDVEEYAAVFGAAVSDGVLDLPLPGGGRTGARLAALAALGRADPVLARLGEGHADALAILAELGGPDPGVGPWGVWAARPESVTAVRVGAGWRLRGERPWCSGAGCCAHALVTAATEDAVRLFAVDLGEPGVSRRDGSWPAVGMAGSDSRTVCFDAVPATPVGGPGDYTGRPGFWAGAVGVAACWYGAATGVAEPLLEAARRGPADPHLLAHLGAVDAGLTAARVVLADAAGIIDAGDADGFRRTAGRVRAVVEQAATTTLDRVGRALGAGPLCRDGRHARRVADLTVYLRQSHAERDLAALGADVAASGEPGW